jgi:ligand-binding sensor domain-containing protein/serine phosphatase RsbU (regulator of sigma subunit)
MKKVKQIYISFVIFCLYTSQVSSQIYNFQRPDFNDFIPPKIYCLIQDSKGYYWFGSVEGVTRFDGSNVTNFGILDGLATGGVKSILEDSNGDIWFGHLYGGISHYNGTSFEKVSFDSITITGDITAILQVGEKIWFTSSNDGAICADFPVKNINKVSAKLFTGKDGLSDRVFSASIKDSTLICVADCGVRRFNRKEGRFEKYKMPNMNTFFTATCFLEDTKDNLWFGTYNGGIYRYSKSQNMIEVIDLTKSGVSSNWVTCIFEDKLGRIWVGTWEGIVVFDGDRVRTYNESNGLKAKSIYSIIEDVEGNILIADKSNGITIFKGDAIMSMFAKEVLPDPTVYTIHQDRTGAIWFGTGKGLVRYDNKTGKNPVKIILPANSYIKDIRFIKEDRNGNLWMGADRGGLIMFNVKTSKFEAQPDINSSLYTGGQVKAFEIDSKNNLWVGTVDGVSFGTIGGHKFARYNYLDSTIIGTVNTVYCDTTNSVWIGTDPINNGSGLIKYNSKTDRFKFVSEIPQISPKSIIIDKNGSLLIGAPNVGVYVYAKSDKESGFLLSGVLRSTIVSDIKVNKNNDIFIGTRVGLYIYNQNSNKLLYLSKKDGLCDNDINCIFIDKDNYAWIGTTNGVSRITADMNVYLKPAPNPILRNIEINAKQISIDSISRLKHNQNNLTFTVGFLGFTDPKTISYQARLDGLDGEWVDYASSSKISYPPLDYGKYTLNVKILNAGGSESKEPLIIPFTILPPWWRTKLAFSTYILLTTLSLIIFYRFRERKLIAEKNSLEKAVKERTVMIELQNKTLIEQKAEITDSITYAKYIQSAILPQKDMLDSYLNDYFILFKPRDIVSGDFYWTANVENITVVAAVDCTGHGVPGAFMSMLGSAFLNEIVNKEYVTQPAVILRKLRKEVIRSLHQRGVRGEQKDGMDIAVCSIDFANWKMQFAGANNPLYLIRDSSLPHIISSRQVESGDHILYEIKGDRMPIGFHDTMNNFTLNEIDLIKGDILYLFTDGYADQFGGPFKKKLQYKNFKKLLLDHCETSITEQRLSLDKVFLDWKGNNDQVDDVLLIGIKI